MTAISSSLKKIANTAERLTHTKIKGTDKVRAVVKETKDRIRREQIKRKATKAAKDEQKYQDFERTHLSEGAKIDRDLKKSREELADVRRERRDLERQSRKGKSSFSLLASGRKTFDPYDRILGTPKKAKASVGRTKTRARADFSLGGNNALNLGGSGKRKKPSRLF